jgi:hypothetical protein
LRERFDAGTGLVALGAILLLVSLFVDWYDPSGDAWAAFELTDVVLAACAVAALVGIVPRYAALARAVPAIAFAAFAIVAVQVIDPPPSARDDALRAGAWLALGAGALMALGAALRAASISITVDVRARERRQRTAAIDAREAREAAAASGSASATAEDDGPAAKPRRTRRRVATPPTAAEPAGSSESRRRASARAGSGDVPAAQPTEAGDAEPPGDPDRTQALEPVDRPKDGP